MNSEHYSFALCRHPNRQIKDLYFSYGETNAFETNFYNSAKRIGDEWDSGRNNSGVNWKFGETTQRRSDSGRKGKWTKRLGGERESGRNDPDSVQA